MSEKPVIGIISGMGPAAGLDLASKLTGLTRATSDQDHLPVILMSFPGDIPDRTRYLLHNEGANPGEAIFEVARRLEAAGATVAGIPCNTAHAPPILDHVARRLTESGSRLKLLNMITETVHHLRQTIGPDEKVGILSTTGVSHTRLYSAPLAEAGFDTVELDEDTHHRLIMDALYSREYGLKVVNPPSANARKQVLQSIETLKQQGAQSVILGCTELPLAVPEHQWEGIRLFDPGLLLAKALIRHTYPDSLISDQT
ncbi:MAG: aspartate/glutamate racemase family protein [Rhodothermales bacterium]|nr:aspartate/glutamate racemase family protein [Rhodothermales bacterium]